MQIYFEENKKRTNIKNTDTFIFNIDTASELPIFPVPEATPKINPYLPLMISCNDLPKHNLSGVIVSTDPDFAPKGICKLSKFKRNLNIFCTNNPDTDLFEDVDFNKLKIAITGSVIPACIQERHPLMGIFNNNTNETLTYINYLNEYYVDSDIDIMFKSSNDTEFIDNVKLFYEKITQNLIKINPDMTCDNIKLNLIRKNYIFVSKQFINKYITIPNKDVPNKVQYISKYKDEEHIKLLFKPYFDKLKKEFIKNKKNDYPEIYDINDENDFIICIKDTVKNEIELGFTYKYSVSSPYLVHKLELFPVRGNDFFSVVATFHLPCVRGYYDGNDVYLTPSCISAHLTFMNLDYRYISGATDPIEILNKYKMRGYGTFLNYTEIKAYITYSSKIPFWKNLLGDNPISQINFTHKLFRPRLYNVDTFINSNYVDLENRYNSKVVKITHRSEHNILTNPDAIAIPHINIDIFEAINSSGNVVSLQKWLIPAFWQLTN